LTWVTQEVASRPFKCAYNLRSVHACLKLFGLPNSVLPDALRMELDSLSSSPVSRGNFCWRVRVYAA
jgi:hypothetical protein